MAVKLEGSLNRHIGLPSDTKPTPDETGETLPAGSSFLETDTGRIWRWSGSAWTHYAARDEQAALLSVIYLELQNLRAALTLTGMAQDLD